MKKVKIIIYTCLIAILCFFLIFLGSVCLGYMFSLLAIPFEIAFQIATGVMIFLAIIILLTILLYL